MRRFIATAMDLGSRDSGHVTEQLSFTCFFTPAIFSPVFRLLAFTEKNVHGWGPRGSGPYHHLNMRTPRACFNTKCLQTFGNGGQF